MRVLCYNIEDGGGERLPGLVTAINRLDVDVALLCELNGWPPGLNVQGLRGCLSVNESSATGYRVGVLTRSQPDSVTPLNAGLHHGALMVRAGGMTLIAAHLHPFEEARRIAEAERLATIIAETAGPLILGGDLNSLPDGPQRSGALSVLRRGGLADPLAGHPNAHTLQTGRSPDDPPWRFDYLLSRGVHWSAVQVLHDPAFAPLSDHWPVLGEC